MPLCVLGVSEHRMAGTDGIGILLAQLFVMFLAAKGFGEIAIRLRVPAVIGELIAGIVVAPLFIPGLLGIPNEDVLRFLAEFGVVILLFMIGLETRFQALREVGRTAMGVAAGGMAVPMILGVGLVYIAEAAGVFHNPDPAGAALFVGAALCATSTAIAVRVIGSVGAVNHAVSRIILGAAVIDDVLSLVVLTVIAGFFSPTLSKDPILTIVTLLIETVLFIAIVIVVGTRVVRHMSGERRIEAGATVADPAKDRLQRGFHEDGPFIIAILACLGLSAITSRIGLAAFVGAFFAGMVFADVQRRYRLEDQIRPVAALFVPFFFVYTGIQTDFGFLLGSGGAGAGVFLVVLIILAIVGKLIGSGGAALRHGTPTAWAVGWGMVPRGEVGIIVASVGLSLQIIGPEMFSIVVLMSIGTSVVAPFFFQRRLNEVMRQGEQGEGPGIAALSHSRRTPGVRSPQGPQRGFPPLPKGAKTIDGKRLRQRP